MTIFASDHSRREKKPAEKSQLKSLAFSPLLLHMEGKQTRLVESTGSDIEN